MGRNSKIVSLGEQANETFQEQYFDDAFFKR